MKKIKTTKNLILLNVFVLLLSTVYAFKNSNGDRVFIQEVALISGNTKDFCVGTGLCQIILPDRFPNNSFDAMGEFVVDGDGNVSLRIKKNSISVAKADEQFGNGYFEINKEIDLPAVIGDETLRRGGKPAKIKKGKFVVNQDKDFYTISF